jgi:hypothetical protein
MLMLGMQVAGIMQVSRLKCEFRAFRGIRESVLQSRCYKLLGCTSVRQINAMEMRCDPYKVQRLMRYLKAKIIARDGATSDALKAGLVVNSYSTDKREFKWWGKHYARCI